MTTTTQVGNGRLRRSLAEQIDRLDRILDGLAEALNEAVATAVKEAVGLAVQQAVQAVLVEVLTNADLLDQVRSVVAPQPPAEPKQPSPGPKKRVWANLAGSATGWLFAAYEKARVVTGAAVGAVTGTVRKAAGKLGTCWRLATRFRVPVVLAAAVGIGVGTGAYFGGPYVAAFTGWLAGFTTTLSVQAGVWMKRVFAAPVTR